MASWQQRTLKKSLVQKPDQSDPCPGRLDFDKNDLNNHQVPGGRRREAGGVRGQELPPALQVGARR